MTALILYWVASEEIKGFAITLILGLASNLFTAFFVTRMTFDWLLKKKILKDHLVFLHLFKYVPKINWMKALPVFLTISAILTIGGLTLFLTRDDSKNSKYDIEFTGGTSVQINLKEGVNLDRQKVEDIIHQEGEKLNDKPIAAATVYSVGNTGSQYEITTTETNKTKAVIAFSAGQQTPETVSAAIKKAESAQQADLPHLLVTPDKSGGFVVATSQLNKNSLADVLKAAFPDANISDPQFDEVVTNAVLAAFGDKLEILKNLQPKIVSAERITDSMIDYSPQLTDFVGGVAIRCDLETAAPFSEIKQRLSDLRSKPDMVGVSWYSYRILDSDLKPADPNQVAKSFVYVVGEPEIAAIGTDADVWAQFVDGEKSKVTSAMQLAASLPQVTQISPSIGKQAKNAALIAAILSLIAMMVYLALRFGDLRYGIGGIVTLAHDTTATMGALMCCAFLSTTVIGRTLLISDFKIDMTMVGAILTLLGYSINDSIIIYDRIRENRRKGTLTPQLINDSINATLSRTILTSTTVFMVVLVMYIFGGKGLRGFNFAMLFGVIEGTYSSIAISAPILLIRAHMKAIKSAPKPQQV
jgi:SecD/SecF fusion protein